VACASGNLSKIYGTTCDIGNLQFSFLEFVGTPWTDGDFSFTVLSNGFELSGPPAQTVTAPANGSVTDGAELFYSFTDLTAGNAITAVQISGGNPSASGSGSFSSALNSLVVGGNEDSLATSNEVDDKNGTIYYYLGFNSFQGPVFSGGGVATPFYLSATDGDTASIDSTTTSFTFTTGPASLPPPPVPEPRLLALLSIGVLVMAGTAKRRMRRQE
jgi:hypothetical protein